MRNRRTVSRYHLIRPLTGYIEHGETRHLGEIVEFSTAGFRLRLRDTSRAAFATLAGGYDFGEIIYKQDEIGGFGDIRYVRPEGNDLLIGFKWDDLHADENIQKSFAIIAELVAAGIAGCVNIGQGQVELAGHVSAALYDDVEQCVAQGISRVSLREAISVDEGGLAMLIRLENEEIRLLDVSPEISALLQRHRQQADSIYAYCRVAA
ncbi:MAG: hypothetical protein ACM31P_03050 [Actinomycetota bacterium]